MALVENVTKASATLDPADSQRAMLWPGVDASVRSAPVHHPVVVRLGSGGSPAYARAWEGELSDLAAGGFTRVVIDLGEVDSLGTAAISVLLTFQRRLEESGGRVRFARLGGGVRAVLRFTRLESVFAIDASIEQSVAALLG